jgi:uncharacterized membrane protein
MRALPARVHLRHSKTIEVPKYPNYNVCIYIYIYIYICIYVVDVVVVVVVFGIVVVVCVVVVVVVVRGYCSLLVSWQIGFPRETSL